MRRRNVNVVALSGFLCNCSSELDKLKWELDQALSFDEGLKAVGLEGAKGQRHKLC